MMEGRRYREPRNAGSLWDLKKVRKGVLPWSLQKHKTIVNPCFQFLGCANSLQQQEETHSGL